MYTYSPKEINKILSNYKKINCFKYDAFNQDNTDLLLDIERALSSKHLSSDQLAVLFCFYTLELNIMESATLLSLEPQEVSTLKKASLDLLSSVLNGYKTKYRQQDKKPAYTLILTLEKVRRGELCIMSDITRNAQLDLLEFLKGNHDKLAKNAFDFFTIGFINDEQQEPDTGVEYPDYETKEDGGRDYFAGKDQRHKVYLLDNVSMGNMTGQKTPARKKRTSSND